MVWPILLNTFQALIFHGFFILKSMKTYKGAHEFRQAGAAPFTTGM